MMHTLIQRPRKRQRRQATALVVESFFTMGKKSTAQPRPAMHVPPRGIGPIAEPNENDVLCGRGGRINAHEGNVQFREIVVANKKEYLAKSTKKLEKAHIAARVVEYIRTMNPPGRFLKEDADTGMWFDIGDAKAIKKAGQALREDAPDIRSGAESGDDDDDDMVISKKTSPKVPKKEASPPLNNTSAPSSVIVSDLSSSRPSETRAPTSSTSGRGTQRHASWHSTGSSTFGMSFPSQAESVAQGYPPKQAAHAVPGMAFGFPSTASVGSAQHSLRSGEVLNPTHLYHNIRNISGRTGGKLSKRAAEIMHFQNQQAHVYRQTNPGRRLPTGHPDEFAFGRVFTPTELSSGSTMSTLSCVSALSNTGSNLTGSHLMGGALSLGSSGLGQPSLSANSMRFSQMQAQPSIRRGSQVSQLTTSFMYDSGMMRSPSFDDLTTSGGMPMSDSSFAALLAEDKEIGDILTNLPPPMSSGTSSKSSNSAIKGNVASSAMSVTSVGSNRSIMNASVRSMGSDTSWLQPYHQSMAKETSTSGDNGETMWPDDRSMMSDVSSIIALDLALPSQM